VRERVLYICGSDEEAHFRGHINVHKLALSNFERPSPRTLAANAEFLDQIQVRLAVMLRDVAQQAPALAHHL
jgi:hypothetical protein